MASSINPGVYSTGKLTIQKAATRKNLSTDMKVGRKNVFDYSDSAISDGSTDARAAILAANAEGPVYLPPGNYAVASNMTLTNNIKFEPGAKLKPASGVVVTLDGSYTAEDTQYVFDISAGGSFVINARSYVTTKHFGALGDNVADDTSETNAAINSGAKEIYITSGQYKITGSLNCTTSPAGRLIRGSGVQTQLNCTVSGKCIFDCTGNTFQQFENFWIRGETAAEPDAAFLFARKTGNGTAGLHKLRNIQIVGDWEKAGIVSISSEVNTYDNVYVDNASTTANSKAICITEQNDFSVTTDFETFPVTFSGGNTVHKFIGGVFNVASTTGIQIHLDTVRDASFIGSFFSPGGQYGFQINACEAITVTSATSEWGGDYGFRITSTLKNSVFQGEFNKGVYGADSSTITNCQFNGTFVGTPGISVYDMHDSIVSMQGFDLTIRNLGYGNKVLGAKANIAGTTISLPSTQDANSVEKLILCGDGKYRGYHDHYTGTKSRFVTHFLKYKGLQAVTQAPTFASSLTPAIDSGTTYAVVLTGNLTVNDFNYGDYQPGATEEGDGLEFVFIFVQDGTGGRTVTLPGGWKTNFELNTLPNAVNVVTIKYSAVASAWVQVAFESYPIQPLNSTSLGTGTKVYNFNDGLGHHRNLIVTGAIALQFNATKAGYYTVVIEQDGTGGHAVTYATTMKGTAPTINTAASEKTIIPIFYDGATWFHV